MSRCARCDWTTDPTDQDLSAREQADAHAESAGHPLCGCCHRSLTDAEPRTCERCLTAAQANLAGIALMWDELPRHLGHARSQRYDSTPAGGDERPLPGGTVLALLGPGGTGNAARRLTRSDVAQGKDGLEHSADNAPDDAPSVAWALSSWEDDWRNTRGEPAAVVPGGVDAEVRAAHGYLERHARWAANTHWAFAEYAADLQHLHLALEHATGRVRRERDAGARCFDCRQGTLVHPVDRATGLEDEDNVLCRACGASYDPARFALALRLAVEQASTQEIAGDTYATPTVLARSLERPERTLRGWARLELVRRQTVRGVLYLHVGDVAEQHAARPTRKASA